MFDKLKNHPFAVEAFFETSLVLSYAVPKEELYRLIPPCLEPDTFGDKWGFIAVAMVQTRGLRPKGFPAFMGNDFFLTGFRVFVRYTNNEGRRLRGLYILKSETNKKKMELLGNVFTHYNYSTTDISQTNTGDRIVVASQTSGILIEVIEHAGASLPAGSPFHDWKEARRFAGPLPFTFTYNEPAKEVLIIEGVREHWKPAPVEVIAHKTAFVEQLGLSEARLANAFIIHNIPYYWKKGRSESWKG